MLIALAIGLQRKSARSHHFKQAAEERDAATKQAFAGLTVATTGSPAETQLATAGDEAATAKAATAANEAATANPEAARASKPTVDATTCLLKVPCKAALAFDVQFVS